MAPVNDPIVKELQALRRVLLGVQRLSLLDLIDRGVGAQSHVEFLGAPFLDGKVAYRNESSRTVGVRFEVLATSAAPGATFRPGRYAPIAALVGARSPVTVLQPNEEITLSVSAADVKILMSVTDPMARLRLDD